MDATKFLSQLTDTWTQCLDQYYDHVVQEHMKTISEMYNIPLPDLMIKSTEMKSGIMKKLTNCMPDVQKNTSPKKQYINKIENEPKLESLGRKELQTMCKERNIPTKRKNADMVTSIKEHDLQKVQLEKGPEQKVEEEQVIVKLKMTDEEPSIIVPQLNIEDGDPDVDDDFKVDEEIDNDVISDDENNNELHEDEYLDEEYD